MKSVFSKSNYLLFVTVIVLLLSIVNAGVVYFLSDRLRQDARLINYAGILRGSIQRAVKLETAGVKSDPLIQQIDGLINSFEDREKLLKLQKYEGRFIEELDLLKGQWGDTVRRIGLYREEPSRERLRGLLESSEKCWNYSNKIVFTAQYATESKLRYFGYIFVVIGLNIIGVLLIIDLIRSYVRDQLEIIANYDSLTRVHNRYSYNVIMEREVRRSQRYESPLSLIVLDIDHFKKVNDTLGHRAGDSVLREMTMVLQERIRNSDYLCRIGGEEFAVIAVETHLANARGLAEKLRAEIGEYAFREAGKVTASFGVAELVKDDTPDTFFRRADRALYLAKERGRNRVET